MAAVALPHHGSLRVQGDLVARKEWTFACSRDQLPAAARSSDFVEGLATTTSWPVNVAHMGTGDTATTIWGSGRPCSVSSPWRPAQLVADRLGVVLVGEAARLARVAHRVVVEHGRPAHHVHARSARAPSTFRAKHELIVKTRSCGSMVNPGRISGSKKRWSEIRCQAEPSGGSSCVRAAQPVNGLLPSRCLASPSGCRHPRGAAAVARPRRAPRIGGPAPAPAPPRRRAPGRRAR